MASSQRFHAAGLVRTTVSLGVNTNVLPQLEKYSLPMSYYFQMECRRWAPTCDMAGLFGPFLVILMDVGLTGWTWSTGICRDAGMFYLLTSHWKIGHLTASRIVEYATREQAQQAVTTLSNQNLMGRLVYVREVRVRTDLIIPRRRTAPGR
jgi:hypothetical protein